MYRLAEDWGLAPEGYTSCRSIAKYPRRRRERFLTEAEFDRMGCVLDEVGAKGGASAPAVAAIRLLMLTGCRKSEILTLRWEDVALGEGEFRLPDTKTGSRVVLLSGPLRSSSSPTLAQGTRSEPSSAPASGRAVRGRCRAGSHHRAP